MNIGIDLDNVLADFQTTWLSYHNSHHGTNLQNNDITVYDYAPIIGIPTEEVVKRVYAFYDSEEFDDIKPEKGAESVIPVLSQKHTLSIITSRPDKTMERTKKWIERYFNGHIDQILHTNQFSLDDKGKKLKSAVCKDNDITLMIEDAPGYAEEVAAAGITTLLLDQVWNRDMPKTKNVVRVSSWEDIKVFVEKM